MDRVIKYKTTGYTTLLEDGLMIGYEIGAASKQILKKLTPMSVSRCTLAGHGDGVAHDCD